MTANGKEKEEEGASQQGVDEKRAAPKPEGNRRRPLERALARIRVRSAPIRDLPALRVAGGRIVKALTSFGGVLAVTLTIVSGVISVLVYVESKNSLESYLRSHTGGFTSTVIRASPIHVGNAPEWDPGDEYPYVGPTYDLPFDCPDVDSHQMAVLTFEVFDVRATRHIVLNGSLLPEQPAVVNAGMGSWDTIVVLVDAGLLQSANNRLVITALDEYGRATGQVDDFLIRNITLFYKPREST